MLESKWVEREEELSVICIRVVVKGKERDQSAERGSYMMKSSAPRKVPWEHNKRKYERTRGCSYM